MSSYAQVIHDLSAYTSPNFYFRFRDWSDGSSSAWGTGVDSIRIEPNPAGPPNCASIVSPADLATDVQITETLNWAVPQGGGAPTGYKLFFGTDNPPTNIVNGTNIGNVLTYDPNPNMAFLTVYYWKVVPTNGSGDASGCPVWSFTTAPDPTVTNFPYGENWDGPINGWTVEDANADGFTWFITTTSPRSAPNAAGFEYNPDATTPVDDWLYSPPLSLTSTQSRFGIGLHQRHIPKTLR
jgi:hypothetical protein